MLHECVRVGACDVIGSGVSDNDDDDDDDSEDDSDDDDSDDDSGANSVDLDDLVKGLIPGKTVKLFVREQGS